MATIFSLSLLATLPFWLLVILLPHWSVTRRVIGSPLVVVPVALLYAALVVPRIGGLVGSFTDVSTFAAFAGTQAGAALVWAHLLTSDLFVARWIHLDARGRGISAWVTSPLLATQFMLGHLGLLAYLAVRDLPGVTRRPVTAAAGAAPAGSGTAHGVAGGVPAGNRGTGRAR